MNSYALYEVVENGDKVLLEEYETLEEAQMAVLNDDTITYSIEHETDTCITVIE